MSDGHYDAPAYCHICDRPIATGPLCEACEKEDWFGDDEVEVTSIAHGAFLRALDDMIRTSKGDTQYLARLLKELYLLVPNEPQVQEWLNAWAIDVLDKTEGPL